LATVHVMTSHGTTLSEAASKALLREYGVPMADEREVATAPDAAAAAAVVGFPVVVKLCGDAIAHKTERGLVKLRLGRRRGGGGRRRPTCWARPPPTTATVSLLVAPMISGNRELIAGVVRDPQFGANVMLGVGGVLAEAIADVVFRPVPLSAIDASEMIDQLKTQKLLGEFRGEAAVDRGRARSRCCSVCRRSPRLGPTSPASTSTRSSCAADGLPVAVDALVEIGEHDAVAAAHRARPTDEQFRALFEPKGVLVTGASTHPGKFGFVSLHNILASGYARGRLRHQPPGRGGAGHPHGGRHRRAARRRHRSRLRVHPRERPTPTC
jgi:hypothetical protein